jgi:hypothetical protein
LLTTYEKRKLRATLIKKLGCSGVYL